MGSQVVLPVFSHLLGPGRDENAVRRKLPQPKQGKNIHALAGKQLNELSVFEINNLMQMYMNRGRIKDARHVFDTMPKRNVVSWNIMIVGYAKQEGGAWALDLYERMQQEGFQPNDRTFVGALKACSSLAALEEGKQVEGKFTKIICLAKGKAIHSQIIKTGFESDVYVGNNLVNMYEKCGSMQDAWCVFDALSHRDVVTWNTMILGNAEQEDSPQALNLYVRMHQEGVQSDDLTYLGALKACCSLAALEEGQLLDGKYVKIGCLVRGRAIHSQAINHGFESDVFVGTILVHMYAKCGNMEDARHIFDQLPHRDAVTWDTMILGYVEQEDSAWALKLYAQMHVETVQLDARTYVGALKACSSLAALEGKQVDGKSAKIGCLAKGRAIHYQLILKGEFESDVFLGTSLVNMYAKCGSMEDAWHMFDELPDRNVVTWNSMIVVYAEQEASEETFRLYAQMQEQGLSPDSYTFVAVLKASGKLGALETGREFHSEISRAGFETAAIVKTTLIDMYAKCGSMVDAQHLFDVLPTRDVVVWGALIGGYARKGESELVFQLFEKMRQESIQPDRVMFLSVLSVCSHLGLVDKGSEYFQDMSNQYGMIPTMEHYTCMVDLLARVGRGGEAL